MTRGDEITKTMRRLTACRALGYEQSAAARRQILRQLCRLVRDARDAEWEHELNRRVEGDEPRELQAVDFIPGVDP